MNEIKYEKIDFYNLPSGVTMNFEHKRLNDNSLVLTRFKVEEPKEPQFKFSHSYYGGEKAYELIIPHSERKLEAVVIICRTSANHYVITGSTESYTKTGYGKTVSEVGAFILRYFVKTLLDDKEEL